jgi:hypothetical protein
VTVIEPTVGARTLGDARALNGPPGRKSPAQLLAIVRDVAAAPEVWRPHVRHELYRRHFSHLVFDDDHEVLVICWEVSQTTLLHDHETSAGAFVVVEGSLIEDYGRVGSRALRQRRMTSGRSRSFGPGYVHDLLNPGPLLATSIHAYSPPITRLNYYAVLRDGVERVRTVTVDEPEPAAR